MSTILEQIKLFLSLAAEGKANISEEVADRFAAACKTALLNKLTPFTKEHTIRMSTVGRPLCQQQMEKAGAPKEPEPYNSVMKFLYGDLIEALAVAIMEGAGVAIQEKQTPVERVIAGANIKGTLDVVIEGKVYDVKSASKYSFTSTYNRGNDGFQKLRENDPFGYMAQGYNYSDARKLPFGGWIAINKESGEWAILEPPPVDNAYRKETLEKVETAVSKLLKDEPFARCFEPEPETYYKKRTGNTVLPFTCSYCSYKQECWKNQGLSYTENPRSRAEPKSKSWYIGEVK